MSIHLLCRTRIILLLLFSLAASSFAITINVPAHFPTIQQAIDASSHGDDIIVSPGTYVENINFNGKNITLRSTDPTKPHIVATTVIDGNQAGSVVTFSGSEVTSCVLSGFTITNGVADSGGGINGNGTQACIHYNQITTNSVSGHWPDGLGGGLKGCDGTIAYNTISENYATYGGGLAWCHGIIQNNTISYNWALWSGGGLWDCDGSIRHNTISANRGRIYGSGLEGCDGMVSYNTIQANSKSSYGGGLARCNGTIQNNTITANSASHGGGLYFCNGTIQSNTISGNSAYEGGGVAGGHGTLQSNTITGNTAAYGGGLDRYRGTLQNNTITGNTASYGGGLDSCNGAIRNCIIWGNSAYNGSQLHSSAIPFHSCIEGWTGGGAGNISLDPLFADSASQDYHLQAGSPCIDAGVSGYWFPWPQWDRDGNCRLVGASVDMGAYEYDAEPDGDGDLLSDHDEALRGTDPMVADSDGDGLRDGLEIIRGSDPLSPTPPATFIVPSQITTIQRALALSVEGDEIVVSPGSYYENLELYGPDIVLRSLEPTNPATVSSTIIDGSAWGSVVTFSGEESPGCALSGFTIRNGNGAYGGGIKGQGTKATIQYCHITHNEASFGGGLFGCHGTIQHNTVSGNSARDGGGLGRCDGTIQNNIIAGNTASSGGGLDWCNDLIQNNIICGNSAPYGGGLGTCHGIIQNNTIAGNSAGRGGGLDGCRATIRNCIIWGNSASNGPQLYESAAPAYSCIEGWSEGGVGNINADPLFVDPANGDYHLRPGSPCIDAGASGYWRVWPQWDRDGNCRFSGASVDMGAYEYDAEPDGDGDLLSDHDETLRGTDPLVADSDGDGLRDGLEIIRGNDPLSPTPPATLYVPSQIASIQRALGVSIAGDEIVVSPGTYYENLEFYGQDIVLRSIEPSNPATVSSTIIDGSAWGSVVTFSGEESPGCVLSGFTISNGSGRYDGGGIYGQETRATIQYCHITDNEASSGGGLYECYGVIQYNTISGNSARDGGGLGRCDGTIQNNIIAGNTASSGGGLDWCNDLIQNNTIYGNSANNGGGLHGCSATIHNNTIQSNSASYSGGGLYYCRGSFQGNIVWGNSAMNDGGGLYRCASTIQNNTIYGNSANNGGGISGNYGLVRNCIVWSNNAPTGAQLHDSSIPSYSCIQDWPGGGTGNISDNPQLVDPDNGDFHLQHGSPCIDAGDPDPQYNDRCRPPAKGSERNDMGAYGGSANCGWLRIQYWNFDSTLSNWQFQTHFPTSAHLEHWSNAFPTPDTYSLSLYSPCDESTNYFALWDSLNTASIPFTSDSFYQVDWVMSTDRSQPDFTPSFRLRTGLSDQKAFSCSRLYPGDWLPLAQRPESTLYQLFFEPPISDEGLFLAFSLIDWANDFRQTEPAGALFLEEVSVYRYSLSDLTDWQELLSLGPDDFSSWQTSSSPYHDPAVFTRDAQGLSISSGIDASRTVGSWDSPTALFTMEPATLYRLTSHLSSLPQLGGPELRLRVHTDDFRHSWYGYFAGSFIEGESALPPEEGADYDLYLTLPFSTQPCHASFDLIDFSTITGGTLTLHELSLHTRPF